MSFDLRTPTPSGLVLPVEIDPTGLAGPTRGASAGPHWRRTSIGRYVPATVSDDLVEQRILEAAVRAGPSGAVTGWAALRLRGSGFCDGLTGAGVRLPVPVVEGAGRVRPHPTIRLSRETLPPDEIVERLGVTCTTVHRALYDEVRSVDLRLGVVHVDMALAAGLVDLASWTAYVGSRPWHVRVRHVRAVTALADAASRSPGETRLRLAWVLDGGWPPPLCNAYVTDATGRVVGMPDLLDRELGLVVEYDGAVHRSREQHRRELGREHALRAVGLEYAAVMGDDLHDTDLVVERLAAARERARRDRPQSWGIRLASVDTPDRLRGPAGMRGVSTDEDPAA